MRTITEVYRDYFEDFQFTYAQTDEFNTAFETLGISRPAEKGLTGIQQLIKEKGMSGLYVLEVTSDGLEYDWDKYPLKENFTIKVAFDSYPVKNRTRKDVVSL